jgi:hypothetical protein
MLVGQAVAMKDRFGSNLDLLAAFVSRPVIFHNETSQQAFQISGLVQ